MSISGKNVVVTGGAGFIGSSIARFLAPENHVTVFDDFSTGKKENVSGVSGIKVLKGDVRDLDALSGALRGADIVFHEAANVRIPESIKDPLSDSAINTGGTLNVLELCRKHNVGRVVFASSSAIYGNPKNLPVREDCPPSPLSPYALSKLTAESYVHLYSRLYGMEAVSLRYFNVYGPRQNADSPYSGVISIFMKNISSGTPLKVYGDGRQTRDFVNVSDVVCANVLAAEVKGATGKAFNIGTGKPISISDLIETIKKVTSRDTSVSYEGFREGDVMHSRADISLAARILGYMPKVSLHDGLLEISNIGRNKGISKTTFMRRQHQDRCRLTSPNV